MSDSKPNEDAAGDGDAAADFVSALTGQGSVDLDALFDALDLPGGRADGGPAEGGATPGLTVGAAASGADAADAVFTFDGGDTWDAASAAPVSGDES